VRFSLDLHKSAIVAMVNRQHTRIGTPFEIGTPNDHVFYKNEKNEKT
jgi:hypothetical protein